MREMVCANVSVGEDEQAKEVMLEEKEGLLIWIKRYKKHLIIAGVSITAIVGIILGIKNKDEIIKMWEVLAEKIKIRSTIEATPISSSVSSPSLVQLESNTRPYTSPKEAFDVRGHIRNMDIGKHHSPEKAAEAAALGIELFPNQTWVNTYPKNAA